MFVTVFSCIVSKRGAGGTAYALAAALLFSSCGLFPKVSDETQYVFLLDKSESTLPRRAPDAGGPVTASARAEYLLVLRQIVSALGPGSAVSGAVINGTSLSVTNLPIRAELPAFDQLLDNELVFRDEAVKRKQALLAQFEAAITEGESAQSTCIVDALLLAQGIFEHSRSRRKALIVVSDMIESCQALDFGSGGSRGARGLPRNDGEIKRLIDELQKQRRLPNLAGVVVCVYRVKGVHQGDNDGRRIQLVQTFWREFFSRAGAEVRDYGPFNEFPFASESALDLSLPEGRPTTAAGD